MPDDQLGVVHELELGANSALELLVDNSEPYAMGSRNKARAKALAAPPLNPKARPATPLADPTGNRPPDHA